MTYRERPAPAAGATVWTRVADGRRTRVLPDGCIDLIWNGSLLFVAGPDTRPHDADAAPGTRFAALRFDPGTGPLALGMPADAVRDQRTPLDTLWSATEVARAEDELAAAERPDLVLEAIAARRLRDAPPQPWRTAAVGMLRAGSSVNEVAGHLGWGERQLHRRSLAAFGYGPKVLARILRFQRVLPLARAGVPFATAAAEAGFADQAHLAREARALAGAPLRELLRTGT